MINKRGPRIGPCGTPVPMAKVDDVIGGGLSVKSEQKL